MGAKFSGFGCPPPAREPRSRAVLLPNPRLAFGCARMGGAGPRERNHGPRGRALDMPAASAHATGHHGQRITMNTPYPRHAAMGERHATDVFTSRNEVFRRMGRRCVRAAMRSRRDVFTSRNEVFRRMGRRCVRAAMRGCLGGAAWSVSFIGSWVARRESSHCQLSEVSGVSRL
jgi:hypothetical protein